MVVKRSRPPKVDPRATAIAESLPAVEPDDVEYDLDVISLQDIVITAIEHSEFRHFRTRYYSPDNTGEQCQRTDKPTGPWAIVEPLEEALKEGEVRKPFSLCAATVRAGVEKYLNDRLSRGMPEKEARMMVDGVYTDVLVCDSIVQFIVYGEEVLG